MEVKQWIFALGITGGILMSSGCNITRSHSGHETGIVRGTTSHPATLLFTCDDGRAYETHSRSYGGAVYHFSLTLPRHAVCRLWIRREGSTFRYVTFRNGGKNLSPLLFLKDPQVDLGHLSIGQKDSLITPVGDDVLLAASSGQSAAPRKTARSLCFTADPSEMPARKRL
jgi:hypothetical protein